MTMMLQSFAAGNWIDPGVTSRPVHSAVTGEEIARTLWPTGDPVAAARYRM